MANEPDFRRDHDDPYADGPPLTVDRRRIIQSAAFRRLQHKTQVFVAGRSDHFRTRLAHTLEVADLARGLATRLGLNAELAEATGLAHDLGHAPFGHAGERALDECLREKTGPQGGGLRFEHNAQSLRVVEHLEHPYPEFRGLNLTRALRDCLLTHETSFDRGDGAGSNASPEGRVAALADELTYLLHDLQDGVYARLLLPEALNQLELWRAARVEPPRGAASRGEFADAVRTLRPTVDRIRRVVLDDVAAVFEASPTAARRVHPSEKMKRGLDELRNLLIEHVYHHATVIRMDAKARRIISAVFSAYFDNHRLMPRRYAERVSDDGPARVAADYIAGMTDRYCQDEHARLFDARMEP